MHDHCTGIPDRVDFIKPEVPKIWADLVSACLEKNPAMRPDSLVVFTDNGRLLEAATF